MRVILQKSLATLGDVGEIVTVSGGYGRNFLLPRGYAVIADENNKARFNHLKKIAEKKAAEVRATSEKKKSSLEEVSINLQRKVGEHNKLFGSVTSMDISAALQEKGHDIDRRQIQLEQNIRSTGVFEVPVRLEGGVMANLKVWVASDGTEEETAPKQKADESDAENKSTEQESKSE